MAMANCSYYGNQPFNASAPFDFFSFDVFGNKTPVLPVRDDATGLCLFNTTCANLPNGEFCCKTSQWTESLQTGFFAFVGNSSFTWIILVVMMFSFYGIRSTTCKKDLKESGEASDEEKEAKDQTEEEDDNMLGPAWFQRLGAVGFGLGLGAVITVNIMRQGIAQRAFTVQQRNGMVVVDAFLSPFDDIFSFIEDIVLVKVGLAIASGSAKLMKDIFLVGVFGGGFFGLLGATTMTICILIPPLKMLILNPFEGQSTCPLSGGQGEIVDGLTMFYVLSIWKWPFQFSCSAFRALAFALQDWGMLGVIFGFRGLILVILFMVFEDNPTLQMLGWMNLGPEVAALTLWILSTLLRAPVRNRICGGNGDEQEEDAEHGSSFCDETMVRTAKDGLLAMVTELSVEFPRTITLYVVAFAMGVGSFYQVSTLIAIQMQYGMVIAESAFFQMKLNGTEMIAKKKYRTFKYFFEFLLVFIVGVVLGCFITTYPWTEWLTFSEGRNMCAFASDTRCLTDYGQFFGGDINFSGETMMQLTYVAAPIVAIRCVYRLARSFLYSVSDFHFLAGVSVTCCFVFFVPCIICLAIFSKSTVLAVVVMTITNIVTMFPFVIRACMHMRSLLHGKDDADEEEEEEDGDESGEENHMISQS